jgi:hypothetical protein
VAEKAAGKKKPVSLTLDPPANGDVAEIGAALKDAFDRRSDIEDVSVELKLGAIVINVVFATPASQVTGDEMIREIVRAAFRERGWGKAQIIN